MRRCAVILAGGVGSRLSPLSTLDCPKQFFRLPGETESLLQKTAREAVALVGEAQVWTVAPEPYHSRIAQELAAFSPLLSQQILSEPPGQGTAGAAVAAARTLGHAVFWLLPCDHARSVPLTESANPEEAFFMAEAGQIVTFGIYPDSPSSQYGYLVAEDILVRRFIEKPSLEIAQSLLETDKVWWNSGMFVLRSDVLLDAMRQYAPQVLDGALEKPLSIDHAVMEQSNNLVMLPLLDDGWSDIGSFDALAEWWASHKPGLTQWRFGEYPPITRESLKNMRKVA